MNEELLFIVAGLHIMSWAYVLCSGFLGNKTLLKWNVFYIIPMLYLLQALPWHPFNWSKKVLSGGNIPKIAAAAAPWENLPGFKQMIELRSYLEKHSTINPLSYQGIMLLCMIVSVYRLYGHFLHKK